VQLKRLQILLSDGIPVSFFTVLLSQISYTKCSKFIAGKGKNLAVTRLEGLIQVQLHLLHAPTALL